MKQLLRLDCSARIAGSHSRELADYFEQQWTMANPAGIVVRRDLAQQPVPHIQDNTIEGFYTPAEYVTPEVIKATALSDELIAELKAADEVLISSPLYNLNVPSSLKAYLDQVVRIGHTFNRNESGFYGLLENKVAYLITAKGGVYKGTPMEQYDFQAPYLQAILGYMGIQQQTVLSLEGTSDSRVVENNKLAVRNQINHLFKSKSHAAA